MATTRAVLRDADTMVRRLANGGAPRPSGPPQSCSGPSTQLQQLRPLVQRVLAQTRARLFGGDTHVPDKVLSLFEPHTDDDSERQDLEAERIWQSRHAFRKPSIRSSPPMRCMRDGPPMSRCGPRPWIGIRPSSARAPYLAAGDRGFSSAANEQAATDRGVRRVILPRRGPKSPARRAYERQAWFRRGQRWRVGCEGRISVIKRRHGLRRCRYHGTDGMHRWVGLGVIADNLINMATVLGPPSGRVPDRRDDESTAHPSGSRTAPSERAPEVISSPESSLVKPKPRPLLPPLKYPSRGHCWWRVLVPPTYNVFRYAVTLFLQPTHQCVIQREMAGCGNERPVSAERRQKEEESIQPRPHDLSANPRIFRSQGVMPIVLSPHRRCAHA